MPQDLGLVSVADDRCVKCIFIVKNEVKSEVYS